jgi:hypothetical protein
MLGDVVYTNLNSVSITFNSATGPYPITGFDDPITQRFDPEDKMGQDGQWGTYDYDGHMEIPLEGAILADDSNDYTAKRNALTSCFRYKPTIRQRRSGVLTVTFDGASENVKADVSIESINIPRAGISPNFSEFRIVLISVLPYWVGVTSGNPYYDS